jgi:hypothetical protein
MAYITFQPSDYFNTKLYTGANKSVTGVGFQPDWVWIKQRNNASSALFDAVRGATKFVESNSNNAEVTDATTLTAFGSDGFTLGADSSGYVGGSSQTTVSWNWKANGQGSSNTDGTINTTYTSANTTSGMSIVKWTGTGSNGTIGHGLGVAPKMIMVKNLATTDSWNVYHESIGNGRRLFLDTSGAESTTSDAWNSTSPTTSVFSVGTNTGTNKSGDALIAYCFAEKKGFSKFGKYFGNGSANGTFVYTGFQPGLVIVKDRDSNQWQMFDSKRGVNGAMGFVYPDSSEAETATVPMDIVSNGFKFRDASGARNGNGEQFTYLAIAEHPLVSSNGVPATAR